MSSAASAYAPHSTAAVLQSKPHEVTDVAASSPAVRSTVFVSTFRARRGCEALLRSELERLIASTRRENDCLFCDLFRVSSHDTVFVIHSVWTGRKVWLRDKGWEGHPAGLGLLNQCLAWPIDVVEMEEVA
jgi:hypothetical protein